MGRLVALVMVVCLFLAGCGADGFDARAQDLVDQIPSVPAGATTGSAASAAGCIEVTEDDEYGIEITYVLCGDEALNAAEVVVDGVGSQGSRMMSTAEWVDSESGSAYADFVRRELILGGGCDLTAADIETGETTLALIGNGPEARALHAIIDTLGQVGSSCATAESWLAEYKQAVIALAEGGAQLAAATGLAASSTDEIAELLRMADASTTLRIASESYTNIAWILDESPPDSAAHDNVWWDYSQLAIARGMPGDVDIALVGDSQTQFGLDPFRISQSTGRVTGNFGLPGLAPSSTSSWVERFVVPTHTPEVVVLAVSEIGFTGANDRVCEFDQIGPLLDAQRRALENVPLTSDESPRDIFSGRGRGPLPIQSPYNRAIESRFDENGVFIGFPVLDERAQQNRLEARTRNVALPYCASRTEGLVALAQRLESTNVRTIVAFMPLADYLTVLWDERPDSVLSQVEDALVAAGIDVIDLRVLDPDQMLDAAHANAKGQVALSAELARAINELVPS